MIFGQLRKLGCLSSKDWESRQLKRIVALSSRDPVFDTAERIGISLETAYVLPTSSASDFENITISWSLFYRFDNEDD